jgi:hypothetical protein
MQVCLRSTIQTQYYDVYDTYFDGVERALNMCELSSSDIQELYLAYQRMNFCAPCPCVTCLPVP